MRPILLDINRTVSRIVQTHPSGVDRVEAAYIEYVEQLGRPVQYLYRGRLFYYLFDQTGWQDFCAKLKTSMRELNGTDQRDTVRRLERFMTGYSRKHLPAFGPIPRACRDNIYINVGLAKLIPRLWRWLRRGRIKSAILIHDMIPVDLPNFASPTTRERFERQMKDVLSQADLILCNSQHTQNRVRYWAATWNIPLQACVALPLGVANPGSDFKRSPHPDTFLALGTIEPRKNHQLLLDVWKQLGDEEPDTPSLLLVGRRGWLNTDVFAQLDALPPLSPITELGYVSDDDLDQIFSRTLALLFPSFEEGYGYPLLEAMQRNIPVICSDIPAFREIAGDYPIYLNPDDLSGWKENIKSIARGQYPDALPETTPDIMSWEKYFRHLKALFQDQSWDGVA